MQSVIITIVFTLLLSTLSGCEFNIGKATGDFTEIAVGTGASFSTQNFSSQDMMEDSDSIISLPYSSRENLPATSCEIVRLFNLSITQPCECIHGECTVGVKGPRNFNGTASFDYIVTAEDRPSNIATVSLKVLSIDDQPIAGNITPPAFNKNTESFITLSYADDEGDFATSCSLTSLNSITITSPCSCTLGVCIVGVTGTSNFYGNASFNYTVIANELTSNTATASLTISNTNTPPIANNLTPAAFDEDTQASIVLEYSDVDGDLATSCSISSLQNVSLSSACVCSAGICTVVGVSGTLNFNGSGSFNYIVTANGQSSNQATAALTINSIDDAPITGNLNPIAFKEDTQSVIELTYSDAESDQATSCSVLPMNNVSVTQPCACSSGVCTVGITGNSNFSGAASFTFTVTANSLVSNSSTASLNILPVDDAPVASNISPSPFNEDIQSIIGLTYSDADSDQATSCSVFSMNNVSVTQPCACSSGVCTVGITGVPNYSGPASFNYSVMANSQISNVALASLTILPVNDAPIAINVLPPSFDEDNQVTVSLQYTDVELDMATACSVYNLSNVSITAPCSCVMGLCSATIQGQNNFYGPASFDYTVTAGGQPSNEATASLTIAPVDDAPTANNIGPVSFAEDLQAIIILSYSDIESNEATSCSVSSLNNISVTAACTCSSGICSVGVTGANNYSGPANFSYTLTANSLTSNLASASLNITAVNDAPVATNIGPVNLNEDTQTIVTLSYLDDEGDQATGCALSSLNNISITQNCACSGGICTVGVTGSSNYNGAASFAYTVTAGSLVSNTANAALSINPIDDAPTAINITPTAFNEDLEEIITLSYSDPELDSVTACSISALNNITATRSCVCSSGVCSVGVTGVSDYNGAASFMYTVSSNGLTSNSATASLIINPLPDAPVASNITPPAFAEDTQSIITLLYSDADSDLATVCTVSALNNVTISQNCACNLGICTVGVTGSPNFYGGGSFSYTVTANSQASNVAAAVLIINPVNDAPVAINMTPGAFNEDTQSIITLSYSDEESDQATSCSISSLTNVTESQACTCSAGTCTVGVRGTSNYSGSAGFNFTVTANSLASNHASVSLSILPVDDAPIANNITPGSFNEDTQSIITLSYSDEESDQATSCSLTSLTNVTITEACACTAGTCTVGVTGSGNYYGSAGFNYTITTSGQLSNVANATFTILNIDDAPVANNLTPPSFNEDTPTIITLDYSDLENDLASSCMVSALSNITITQPCACTSGLCTIGVTGLDNFNGTAGFNYTVTSNGLASNVANAVLTINPVQDAPVANNIIPSPFNEDTQSIITLSYTDAESDLATSCSVFSLTNVSITESCTCSSGICAVGVTGNLNYNGPGSFSYNVTANSQVSSTGNATLSIASVDDAPVAINITPAPFDEDTQSILTLNYSDIESDPAVSCSITSLNNVTVTQSCSCSSGLCTVGVTGLADYEGNASFNYTVTANSLESNSASASLVISPVGDAPIAADIFPAAFNEDTQAIITLSYSDPDGDQATSCSLSSLNNISITQSCACVSGVCTVGVTGLNDYHGLAGFSYTVTAALQNSNSASASFTILSQPDAPVASNLTPASFNEDTESIITLSYSDGDSDLATSCSLSSLDNISVTTACGCTAGVCTVGVTGVNNYFGAGSFSYIVTANAQVSNMASASLTISAVDDAPVSNDINLSNLTEDIQSIITLNYLDPESHQATNCSISGLSNLTITQSCSCSAGVCTVGVTGTQNYNGPAGFNYTVTANGLSSNLGAAVLTINPADDAPVANTITPASFNEDTQTMIVLDYYDEESDAATICAVSSLTNVTVSQTCSCTSGTCTVGVTGIPDYNGAASFNYTVTANSQVSNSASTNLNILPVDDAPIATNLNPPAFNEDSPTIITLNYSDLELDPATICTISSLNNITISQACTCVSGTCTVGVIGTANYSGAASFTYTVTANSLTSNIASASLIISPVNDAPVAANLNPSAFNEDTLAIISLDYSDEEADQANTCSITSVDNVTVTQACACTGGICTVGITGTSNYHGTASFNFTVTANTQTSNVATASLVISPVDDAPLALDITPAAINEDTQSTITLGYSDVENDLATSCSITSMNNITVTDPCACVAGVCTVGITGASNYNGAANFNYTVTSNGLVSNTASATFTVSSIDDAPVANNITPPAFDEDIISTITLSYSDTEFDQANSCTILNLSNVSVTTPCNCNLGICTVSVRGNLNYNGIAAFDYTVTANGLTSAPAFANLTISPVDDAPVASNISPSAFNEDTQSLITLNYTDVEGNSATACSVSNLINTSLTQSCSCISGTCTVGITGSSNHNGPASFNFNVTANGLTSGNGLASLVINPVDDAPTADNIAPAAFNEDTQSLISLTYLDIEDHQASACTVSSLVNITITSPCSCSGGLCTVGVTGTANYAGAAGFTYTVTANGLVSNSANASLLISAVNDVPTMSVIAAQSTTLNTASSPIAFTISDVESTLTCSTGHLSMTSSDQTIVSNSAVTWSGNGINCTAVISPMPNKLGPVTLTFTVVDGTGGTSSRSFAFTVNNAPVILEWTTTTNVVINSHDFGSPGTNRTDTVRVRNSGAGVTGSLSFTATGDPNVANIPTSDCTTLSSNAFCTVTLSWRQNPGGGSNGSKAGTITITDGTNSRALSVTGTK